MSADYNIQLNDLPKLLASLFSMSTLSLDCITQKFVVQPIDAIFHSVFVENVRLWNSLSSALVSSSAFRKPYKLRILQFLMDAQLDTKALGKEFQNLTESFISSWLYLSASFLYPFVLAYAIGTPYLCYMMHNFYVDTSYPLLQIESHKALIMHA